eukprot:31529-Pelagococcus_subviridis.AAC.32
MRFRERFKRRTPRFATRPLAATLELKGVSWRSAFTTRTRSYGDQCQENAPRLFVVDQVPRQVERQQRLRALHRRRDRLDVAQRRAEQALVEPHADFLAGFVSHAERREPRHSSEEHLRVEPSRETHHVQRARVLARVRQQSRERVVLLRGAVRGVVRADRRLAVPLEEELLPRAAVAHGVATREGRDRASLPVALVVDELPRGLDREVRAEDVHDALDDVRGERFERRIRVEVLREELDAELLELRDVRPSRARDRGVVGKTRHRRLRRDDGRVVYGGGLGGAAAAAAAAGFGRGRGRHRAGGRRGDDHPPRRAPCSAQFRRRRARRASTVRRPNPAIASDRSIDPTKTN